MNPTISPHIPDAVSVAQLCELLDTRSRVVRAFQSLQEAEKVRVIEQLATSEFRGMRVMNNPHFRRRVLATIRTLESPDITETPETED